jgi:hypothetical protein
VNAVPEQVEMLAALRASKAVWDAALVSEAAAAAALAEHRRDAANNIQLLAQWECDFRAHHIALALGDPQ